MIGRGLFLTLEGGEGCGKSTQAARLAAALRELGHEVLMTREPGGTPVAESVRTLLLDARATGGIDAWAELLFFAGCRAEHRAKTIAPALERGATVVCDRYSDATLAYQGHGRSLALESVRTVCRLAEQGVSPDATLLLDLPVEVGLARVAARTRSEVALATSHLQATAPSRFDAAPPAFHERVRDGYLALAAAEPARFVVVDASLPVEEVTATILAELATRLPGRIERGPA